MIIIRFTKYARARKRAEERDYKSDANTINDKCLFSVLKRHFYVGAEGVEPPTLCL